MRTLLVVAALLAAHPAQAEGLKGIKGADDRVTVSASEYPWSAVGRLNNGQGAHCSGVLIAPDLAVTAAHCLWNKKTRRPMPPGALHFVAGYERGQYIATATVASVVVSPAWRFDLPYSPDLAAADWALLKLAEPLGDRAGWIALGTGLSAGQTVTTVGYGQDRKHVPTAHVGCTIQGRVGPTWAHDCGAVHGDSGGPVIVWQDGSPRLVGIHVATFERAGQPALGGAVDAAAFQAEARHLGALAGSRAGAHSKGLDPAMKARLDGR
ncbi:MAG: trypsin-like serine peptidase [Solirubrobacterales bacterium]